MEQFESFVGINFWTMIFTWCNLVILFLILKKLLFKPIKNMIDSRQKEIDDMYESADKSVKEADELKTEYESKLRLANEEREEILKSAVKRANERRDEILLEAKNSASDVMRRAEEQIELEKKRAMNDIKDEVSSMAVGIASAMIEKDIDEKDHERLVDEFIAELGESND